MQPLVSACFLIKPIILIRKRQKFDEKKSIKRSVIKGTVHDRYSVIRPFLSNKETNEDRAILRDNDGRSFRLVVKVEEPDLEYCLNVVLLQSYFIKMDVT